VTLCFIRNVVKRGDSLMSCDIVVSVSRNQAVA